MRYTVDRIYDDYVVLENQENYEMIDIERKLLPIDIKEGSILVFDNNTYYIDEIFEQEKRLSILEKFNKLRNKTS